MRFSAFLASSATAQHGGGSGQSGAGSSSGSSAGGGSADSASGSEMARAIFLSGKVIIDDGTVPREAVVIERVCGTTRRPEGQTDSKGRFRFQFGQRRAMLLDAGEGRST